MSGTYAAYQGSFLYVTRPPTSGLPKRTQASQASSSLGYMPYVNITFVGIERQELQIVYWGLGVLPHQSNPPAGSTSNPSLSSCLVALEYLAHLFAPRPFHDLEVLQVGECSLLLCRSTLLRPRCRLSFGNDTTHIFFTVPKLALRRIFGIARGVRLRWR